MKKVYICSRYRADETRTVEENVQRALEACRKAALMGYAPYASHLYLPNCLDDNKPEERELGLKIGQEFLKECDEVWLYGADISEGMRAELALAEKLGIPVRFFSSADMRIAESTVYAKWVIARGEAYRDIGGERVRISATCTYCGIKHNFRLAPLLPGKCPTCGALMGRKDGRLW